MGIVAVRDRPICHAIATASRSTSATSHMQDACSSTRSGAWSATCSASRQGAQQAEARAERAVELAQERVVPAYERL